jgi:hypothetical protein
MNVNNKESETSIESELNKLNISDKSLSSLTINHGDCYQPPKKLWCKECVPSCIIEGWTSGNFEVDSFIKDTIYNANPFFLEWVPFKGFKDIKPIGEGGFAKVYSAKWTDGKAYYTKQDNEIWKKLESEPITVALKRLNGSQNMSAEYLNEVTFICFYFFNYKYFVLIYLNFNINNSLKHIGMFV